MWGFSHSVLEIGTGVCQHVSTTLTSRYLQIWLKTETRTDSGMSKLTNAKQQTKKTGPDRPHSLLWTQNQVTVHDLECIYIYNTYIYIYTIILRNIPQKYWIFYCPEPLTRQGPADPQHVLLHTPSVAQREDLWTWSRPCRYQGPWGP